MNKRYVLVCEFLILVNILCSALILTDPDEFMNLDMKITKFLKGPTKQGFEDNLKDIEVFTNSINNMILMLNGTLPSPWDFLSNVKKFYNNDKPVFIDVDVVEYELQPVIKVSDEDFNRLCRLRVDAQECLIELGDLEKLDQKIHSFLKNPSKEEWEDNLKDVDRFDNSMKSMIKTMNATFEGLTKDYLRKVENFVHNGKPFFIDTDVVEYEVQPRLGLTDGQLQKLYWARLHAEQDWEMVVDMLTVKKQVEFILPD